MWNSDFKSLSVCGESGLEDVLYHFYGTRTAISETPSQPEDELLYSKSSVLDCYMEANFAGPKIQVAYS